MALPKEPRQKMINMMYLVLTAMLALNVSSEILHAFKTVNESLANSNTAIESKNQTLFKSFQEKLAKAETKEKAEIWWPKAKQAKDISESIYSYIDDLKEELKRQSGYNPPSDTTYKEDNLDAPTRLFVEGKKKGPELYKRLDDFKKQLLAIDPEIGKEFGNTLPLDLSIPKLTNSSSGSDDKWSYAYFHMTPTIAALTILSKFQNDVKNSESQVVEFCHKKIGAVDVVFDSYAPLYGQNAEYLMPGQELRITAGIGAFNKQSHPTVTVDGAATTALPDGSNEYKTIVGGPGAGVKKLHISFFNQATGKQETRDVDIKYTVGSPTGASVSADATKVFYIGLENPISVSGGTKGDEATHVTVDNGHLTKIRAGKYDVKVDGGTESTVTVTVDGKSTPFKFRVKTVPDPIAMIGKSKGGRIPANEFKAQQGVRAELENFIFEGVKYDVVGFTLVAFGKGFSDQPGYAINRGAAFGADAKRIIEKASGGTSITIDEIKAVGPGVRTVKLAPIPFNLY
jgi:gliding motility-associated protein GldM